MRNIDLTISLFKARPLSRKKIRKYANELKELIGISNHKKVDIIKVLEYMSLISGFNYEIVEDEELPNNYAETDILNGIIRIRESVYMRASGGNPRDRFTIAHEIGHYFLHSSSLYLARTVENIKPYEHPEWQANVFAAEFLVATNHIENLTAMEVANTYNVSLTVASIQLKESKKESFF